jgi:membrane protein YdbS with pleckstrin-like domain
MDGQSKAWFVQYEGKIHGPYTQNQLINAIKVGRFLSSALIRREDQSKWHRLGDIISLAAGATEVSSNIKSGLLGDNETNKIPAEQSPLTKTDSSLISLPGRSGQLEPISKPLGNVVVPMSSQAEVKVSLGSPVPGQESIIWEGRSSLAYHMPGFLWSIFWLVLWIRFAIKSSAVFDLLKDVITKHLPQDSLDISVIKVIYLKWFFAVLALLALWGLIYRVLRYLNLYYVFTIQRFKVRKGILSHEFRQIELFRIKDIGVIQTLWGRLFNYAHIDLISTDRLIQDIRWHGLPDGVRLAEKIRSTAQMSRAESGITTIHE